MITFNFDIGRSGSRLEQVPRCFYDFVTIYNNTRFDFTLFKGNSNLVQDIIGSCPAYTTLTFPHDKLVDTVNFVWTGGGGIETAQNERCKIFFTVDNLGLVGQFRAPEINPVGAAVELPGDTLYEGRAVVGNIITCQNKIIVRAAYFTNLDSTVSLITLRHQRGAVNRNILTNLSIPVGGTNALGYFVLLRGHIFNISAFTGNIDINIYGEGS